MEESKKSLEMFQHTYKFRPKIHLIIEKIKEELIDLLGNLGIFIAISNVDGNIKYIDPELDKYYDYIQKYCKNNGKLIEIGSFSIPLKNMIFFRISERVIICFSTKVTKVERLVTFICKMEKYRAILNHIIDRLKTVNYWNLQTSSTNLFQAFQSQMYSNEIDDLMDLVEKYLSKSEFKKCLNILNKVRSIAQKLGNKDNLIKLVDQVSDRIAEKLKRKEGIMSR